MDIKVHTDIGQIDRDQWQNFVIRNEHANVFQSPVMFDIYSGLPKFKPFVIVISGNTSAIYGLLFGVIISDFGNWLKNFTSRTVIWGGPIIDPACENKKEIVSQLLTALTSHTVGKSLIIEFRNINDLSFYKDIFIKKRYNYLPWSNIIVGSLDEKDFIKQFNLSKQRQVKKSLKNGAVVRPVANTDEIKELYKILNQLYKTRVKKPLPPIEFFESIYRAGKDSGECVILVVVFNEKIAGGIVSMITPGQTIYEWYVCGLDREYSSIHPSVMATWGAMSYASNMGIKQFDFMGIGQPGEEYGVKDFKMQFGGQVIHSGRFLRINNRLFFNIAKFSFGLLTRFNRNLSY